MLSTETDDLHYRMLPGVIADVATQKNSFQQNRGHTQRFPVWK